MQEHIDPADLSVKIMQSYANFTVGGSLAVNAHGRYVGAGPVILSVRSIKMVLPDGTLLHASRTVNPEIFFGADWGLRRTRSDH
ncbi:MAG: FAD-binding protein [Bryobacteraceae bacterium]